MSGRGQGEGLRSCCARPRSAHLRVSGARPGAPPAPPPSDPAELDPSAPLDPMPDLGVDWPDPRPRISRPRSCPTRPQLPSRDPPTRQPANSLHACHRGTGRRRRAEELLRRSACNRRCRRTARTRQMPRRSTAARAPMPTCSRNCCAARAITMPTSSRGPSAAGDVLRGRARGRARRAIPFRLGRACPGSTRRARKPRSCARRLRSNPAIRSSPQDVIAGGLALKTRLASKGSPWPKSASSRSRSITRRIWRR